MIPADTADTANTANPPNVAPSSMSDDSQDGMDLADYARSAYLEYALSVVKGRALPDVCDGQKPVQRRILYAMSRMGLGFGGANGKMAARPVKCARVVGDVLGRFHPHGDQAAYDALVRMAQGFCQRYPLIDGQGNFGSRDGDGAAAMRYTEARLARITCLLTDEIDEGTVDFVPNYDGSTIEPKRLPARLPFCLLNGASGIAVGLATEIPSHNLREVTDACVALIQSPEMSDDDLWAILPGPDYAGGGQIISSADVIAQAYRTGRGSIQCRARWKVEDLAHGQWQWVVTELPPGVSTQRVLEEIEELVNPKVKAGKKALSSEQMLQKAALLSVLDSVRDESGQDAAVRLVCEPKICKAGPQALINLLLAHTSLEVSCPVNLTLIGLDGRPVQKSMRQMLTEWIAFRQTTVERRSRHRLSQVLDRIHILEGRAVVLLNVDEVIAIIRQADDPRAALIARFHLSPVQADDILDIRLRQLARLEAIKIEQELSELRDEQRRLSGVLDSPAALRRLMVKEMESDARQFADARRTLILADNKAVPSVSAVDEPVTVVVSQKGWVRVQKGWSGIASEAGAGTGYSFKAGDALYGAYECRTTDTLLAFGGNGRVYSVAVGTLPGGRGDGQPVTSLIELEVGTQLVHYFAGPPDACLLLCGSGGYGLMATVLQMTSRHKAGKAFVSLNDGEVLCAPSLVSSSAGSAPVPAATHVACASTGRRILTFAIDEIKIMGNGGRGLLLIDLEAQDTLAGAAAYTRSVRLEGQARSGTWRNETLEIRSLNNAKSARARKGKQADLGFKPVTIVRVL